jgi:S-adenosylmethionine:tRNA ribosyltransferase-isomerase
MRVSDFDYDLPPDRIAQEPLAERDRARMMVVPRGGTGLEDRIVLELPALLHPGDLLVVNDTRVFPARIYGRRPSTGGSVELLLVEEVAPDRWDAFCRCSGRVRVGQRFELEEGRATVEVVALGLPGRVVVRFPERTDVLGLLQRAGVVPLPPYIRRVRQGDPRSFADVERYQTVFARHTGAVAAPTAGLHFTPRLLEALRERGVATASVTLHVGPGTFKPVSAENIEDHAMESERYEISAAAAAAIRSTREAGRRVVAVGTTVVRVLETVAGEHGAVTPAFGRTALFIRPPYTFRVVGGLLTNFHLPRSTLLMLVSAFAGRERVLSAYAEAVSRGYRFYSYGDCMLLL